MSLSLPIGKYMELTSVLLNLQEFYLIIYLVYTYGLIRICRCPYQLVNTWN